MNIRWYCGFGWPAVAFCLASGAASYYFTGWLHWVFYALFVVILAYMVAKGRLYWGEPWRRVHRQGMDIFRSLTKAEAAVAEREGRPLDMARVCGRLAERLEVPLTGWGPTGGDVLTDAARKAYYRELAETFPAMFTKAVAADKKEEALALVLKDIEASELGPDIVIAVASEQRYGQLEAARFLLALASGATVSRWFLS